MMFEHLAVVCYAFLGKQSSVCSLVVGPISAEIVIAVSSLAYIVGVFKLLEWLYRAVCYIVARVGEIVHYSCSMISFGVAVGIVMAVGIAVLSFLAKTPAVTPPPTLEAELEKWHPAIYLRKWLDNQ